MAFDFANAQLPELRPLQGSYAADEVEAQLRDLFIDLFKSRLSATAFDANVLGAAHLGSFDLVRDSVNRDGLVLLQGDREEAATRYLYRAWKSRNNNGRGIHFLRTYLQMLFPNGTEVNQLWQDKNQPYPTSLYNAKPRETYWLYYLGEPGLKLDGAWRIGQKRPEDQIEYERSRVRDMSNMFLTSRIEIALDIAARPDSIATLINIIRSTIPARLYPIFKFWLRIVLTLKITAHHALLMQKNVDVSYPYCGRVITDNPARKWRLSIDHEAVKLPQAFGSFKVGEVRGGWVEWRLKPCRATSSAFLEKKTEAGFWRVETVPKDPAYPKLADEQWAYQLGEPGLTLNGTWKLHRVLRSEALKLDGAWRIGHLPGARLSLSGRWRLGGPRNPEFTFETVKAH